MTTIQLFLLFVFLMAYYYFVLRTYNTLGFRLFSLCFFVGTGVCYWWYDEYRHLTDIQHNGLTTQAVILKKEANSLTVRFTDLAGASVERTQTGGISVEEFAGVKEGQLAPILYSPQSDRVYLASSYRRRLSDNSYILVFPALLYLIGVLCWIFLRKYRVHAHEGTIYEYVTDERGNIMLDDARNSTTKALRTYSTMSRFFDMFQK